MRTPGVAVAARRVFSHVAGVGAERVDHYDDCHLLVAPLGIGGISAEQLQQLFAGGFTGRNGPSHEHNRVRIGCALWSFNGRVQ